MYVCMCFMYVFVRACVSLHIWGAHKMASVIQSFMKSCVPIYCVSFLVVMSLYLVWISTHL